jgi:putative endonuclease
MIHRRRIGKYGEELAQDYLMKKGYELVEKNFRYERAEVDLIFKDENSKVLIFVEVKTRSSKSFGEPEESVTEMKQEKLVRSAEGFLMEHPEYDEYEKRFDVVAIYVRGNKEEINHIINAF